MQWAYIIFHCRTTCIFWFHWYWVLKLAAFEIHRKHKRRKQNVPIPRKSCPFPESDYARTFKAVEHPRPRSSKRPPPSPTVRDRHSAPMMFSTNQRDDFKSPGAVSRTKPIIPVCYPLLSAVQCIEALKSEGGMGHLSLSMRTKVNYNESTLTFYNFQICNIWPKKCFKNYWKGKIDKSPSGIRTHDLQIRS